MSGGAPRRALAGGKPISPELRGRIQKLYLDDEHAACIAAVDMALAERGDGESAGEDPAATAAVGDVAAWKAWSLYATGQHDALSAWLERAAAEGWLPADDPRAALVAGWAGIRQGRYEQVLGEARQRAGLLADRLDPMLPEYLYLAAASLTHLGCLAEAERVGTAANALFSVLGRSREEAETCNLVGAVCTRMAAYGKALEHYRRAKKLNRRLGARRRLAESHLNTGVTLYKLGRYPEAAIELERALALMDDRRTDSVHYRAKLALGNVHRLRGDLAGARRHLMAAYAVVAAERIPREECIGLEFIGDVLRDEGKPAEARRYYARAAAIARRIAPEGDLVCEVLRRQGEALLLEGRPVEAEPLLLEAARVARRLGDGFEQGVIQRCRAGAALARRDPATAVKLAEGAVRRLDAIGARHEGAVARLVSARALLAEGRRSRGRADELQEAAWREALRAQHDFLALGLDAWLPQVDEVLGDAVASRFRDRPAAAARPTGGRGNDVARPGARIVAASGALREVLRLCDAFAGCEEPVLITGETGTGKELLARRIHELSDRRDRPLVCVNVAAVPATLFEREFFGHSRGAFSGAEGDRPGYVAAADGGTLFLDEIADLPPELQPKLLRLLQERSYSALGDPGLRRADIRLLAATNADLTRLVEEGRFRRDLYYRLRTLEIEVPPLRERVEDVIALLDHFLAEATGGALRALDCFDPPSLRALRCYAWPGNAREVAMVARRAHLDLTTSGRVRVKLGDGEVRLVLRGPGAGGDGDGLDLRTRLLGLLTETGGNKSETARRLGVSRPTLYRWLDRQAIGG